MTAFNLLRPGHIMVGIDLHDAIIPPNMEKQPSIPHSVYARLRGVSMTSAFSSTVKHAPTVQVCSEDALQRATDIGPFIPHEQVNLLRLFIVLSSKSKSAFGAGTVRAEGRPVATAIFQTATVNLNCADPLRLLSGFVHAPNTVRAGMTEGDVAAGLAEIAFDIGSGLLKSKLFSWLAMKGLSRILGKAFQELIKNNPDMKELIEQAVKSGYKKATDPLKPSDEVWDEVAEELNDPKHRVFL
jgi:hypothetical protein